MLPDCQNAWDERDDWTGVTSAKERRKRQNRLHQRAHRKKRHLQRLGLVQSEPLAEKNNSSTQKSLQSNELLVQSLHSVQNLPMLTLLRRHNIHTPVTQFLQKAISDWSHSLPVPRDLPVLSRLNAFDALARNSIILNIPAELIESDDGVSRFFQIGPELLGEPSTSFPPHLAPTALQTTVRHHPWLDLLPFPKMRDNILAGIEKGYLDEDQLADSLVCDFLNLTATNSASLVIWGDSWDQSGWEFSAEFFRKWQFLLEGCQDVLHVTNSWRAKRLARQLEWYDLS